MPTCCSVSVAVHDFILSDAVRTEWPPPHLRVPTDLGAEPKESTVRGGKEAQQGCDAMETTI